jgi:sensor domain CHASE-containing protein
MSHKKIIWIVTGIIIIANGTYINGLSNNNNSASERSQTENTHKVIAACLEVNIAGNLQTSEALISAMSFNPDMDKNHHAQFANPYQTAARDI